jgi:hypothetical protein
MANLIMGHGGSWCFGTSLAPKERGGPKTTIQDTARVKIDGADLSCPGSSVVA